VKLGELTVRTSDAALSLQGDEGEFPPGHNGPYGDPETPIRNTAHWANTLIKAFDITGARRFRDAARRAIEFLLRPEARPMGATFVCRTNPDKDFCNGLIGQAWVIECLVTAARTLDDDRCRSVARELFLLHPFIEERGLWQRVNVDGSLGGVDNTFNHQLWFAAAGAQIDPDPAGVISSTVTGFLDRALEGTLRTHRSGRVRQAVGPDNRAVIAKDLLRAALAPVTSRRIRAAMADREVGYHAFNLHGFAMLFRQIPEHPFWMSSGFARALGFVHTPRFESSLSNRFGGPYNPVGFETAYAAETFAGRAGLEAAASGTWIVRQLDRFYDGTTDLMTRNTSDPETLAARFYEVTRLEGVELEVGDR
jgi:hypothetical protein